MTAIDVVQKGLQVVIAMNSAVTNLRLYPPTSKMAVQSVERIEAAMQQILAQVASLEFSETEKNLLVNAQPLGEKDLQKPQIRSFLDILLNFKIKNIAFHQGIDRDELQALLAVLCKKPGDVLAGGELEALKSQNQLPHVDIDQKVYVAVDHKKQMLGQVDLKDEEVMAHLLGGRQMDAADREKLRERARDKTWISGLIQAGLKAIREKSRTVPGKSLSKSVAHMIQTLDEVVAGENKEQISRQLADGITGVEGELGAAVLQQDLRGELGEAVFDRIGENLVERRSGERRRTGRPAAPAAVEHDRRKKDRRRQEVGQFKAGLTGLLKGDEDALGNPTVMRLLPEAVGQMFTKGKARTAAALIDRVSQGLGHQNPATRETVTKTLIEIGRTLLASDRLEEMHRLSHKLALWLKFEPAFSPQYQEVGRQLQELTERMMRQGRWIECGHILETFNLIQSKVLQKDAEQTAFAAKVLKGIATQEILDPLLAEFRTNAGNQREQAAQTLVKFGDTAAGALLDLLLESEDMYERVRLVRTLSGMGGVARPAVLARLEEDAPWYFRRNLLTVMGKIGTGADLEKLRNFLPGEDFRVQREALNSICEIDPKTGARLLLSLLEDAADPLKIAIAIKLGNLRYAPAVPQLIQLLQTKTVFSSKLKDRLLEKVCGALGQIRAAEAVPVLTSIIEKKGFLGLAAQNKKLVAAAQEALAEINAGQ